MLICISPKFFFGAEHHQQVRYNLICWTHDYLTAKSEHRGNINFNHMVWKEKPAPYPERAQSSLQPLHPEDRQHIFTWALGYVQPTNEQLVAIGSGKKVTFEKPVNYSGDATTIELKIFAKDLFPASITIDYTKEEIKHLTPKNFRPA